MFHIHFRDWKEKNCVCEHLFRRVRRLNYLEQLNCQKPLKLEGKWEGGEVCVKHKLRQG